MSLTAAVASTGSVSPKTSPDSITTVNISRRPNDDSDWRTNDPYVLYTAPSDCMYARIVIPYNMYQSSSSYNNHSFLLEGSSSLNHWLGLAIVNDTNSSTDNIIRGYHSNPYHLTFNHFQVNGQYDDTTMSITNPFDVVANYNQSNYHSYFIIPQERWVLNPGEKFVCTTGNNSSTAYVFANFQAWVYN